MNIRTLVAGMTVCIFSISLLHAQDEVEYKMELGAALGGSFYMGDVNTTFYRNTGFAGAAIGRFLLNPRMAVKGMLTYGGVKGNAADVEQFFPDDPNSGMVSPTKREYQFNSSVTDLSVTFEYNFWPYGIANSYQGLSRITPYIQLGLGLHYAEAGKGMGFALPIGFGIKYKLSNRLNLGLDWSYHFSLSDKIDGLDAPHGISSSGFKNKDSYSFTMIYLTYDLFPKCTNCNKD